ncbi:arginase family protein [Nocardia sp. SYP-A9097]|uniref:arginase family protein n=1 Tax=Nocardia sp. SYP-A9097 TaxID=2663237 RepID=UPI001E444F8A|nr:arginase family protein [Nocardia sp. SYP-A9097]
MTEFTESRAVSRSISGPRSFFRLPHVPLGEITEFGAVDAVLLGVPIDGATGYRSGARFGPEAVRSASTLARLGSRERALVIDDVLRVVDGGDIQVVPGYHEQTLELIERGVDAVHALGALPVLIGGDHSLAIAELRSAARYYGPLSLVQFDAHRDVLDDYFGVEHLHGTVYRRAVEEGLIDPTSSIQIGMRGSVPRADLVADDLGFTTITSDDAIALGCDELARVITGEVGSNPVAITFDIDFVDPANAPGTGTPEVGGPSSAFALRLLRRLELANVRTISLVEISPPYDTADITAHLGVAVIFELLAMVAAERRAAPTRLPMAPESC